jgi:hypothetical protein
MLDIVTSDLKIKSSVTAEEIFNSIILTGSASTIKHRNENTPPLLVVQAQEAMPLGPGTRFGAPEDAPGTLSSVQLKSVFWSRAFVFCSLEKTKSEFVMGEDNDSMHCFRKSAKI